MAFRDDVTVSWHVSPRIITVAAPSTEIVLQDLVDTCRELEQQSTNLVYASLISAAGKEPLGGGVLVGITATLQNAQIEFESRRTPAETGTATSGDATTLTDTSADFVSAGVSRGSMVINFTDGSVGDVFAVINANTLTVRDLAGGTDNDFDAGDAYGVFNITQVSVSGGNIVAVDENGDEISPILPSFGTQVVKTASSSATLREIQEIILLEKLARNRLETDPVTGVMTLYDDDSVTPLLVGNLYEDVAGAQAYRGQGSERRNRLVEP